MNVSSEVTRPERDWGRVDVDQATGGDPEPDHNGERVGPPRMSPDAVGKEHLQRSNEDNREHHKADEQLCVDAEDRRLSFPTAQQREDEAERAEHDRGDASDPERPRGQPGEDRHLRVHAARQVSPGFHGFLEGTGIHRHLLVAWRLA
jgi:hypothetical protein